MANSMTTYGRSKQEAGNKIIFRRNQIREQSLS